MYRNHTEWLDIYILVFEAIRVEDYAFASYINEQAIQITPEFHSEEYILNMKRRLFTKDNIYYKRWSELGESNINIYWSVGGWRIIKQ